MNKLYYKLCLLGDSNAGKSSILERYIFNRFDTNILTTIGAAFHAKEIITNEKTIRLQIWDTAGQERYRALTPMYYKNASMVLIVVDCTDYNCIENSTYWINQVKKDIPDCPIYLVVNKIDLEMVIQKEDFEKWSNYYTTKIMYVSAKSGNNIDALFNDIVNILLENVEDPPEQKDVYSLSTAKDTKSWCY